MSRAPNRTSSSNLRGAAEAKERGASSSSATKPPTARWTNQPSPSPSPTPATPSRTPTPSRPRPPPLDPIHPFANTKSKLELIPPSSAGSSGIDIEEEARLYDELCQSWDGDEDGRELPTPPSPPSISLFSKDITLNDNTGHSSSAFARDVRISGWTQVGDVDASKSPTIAQGMGFSGGGAYVVYDCVITTKEGTTMHILKRYSAFVALEAQLRRTLPRHLPPTLPSLPPKAPLARFRPAFLDRRRRHLQFWLASVLLHPEVGACEAVRGWVLGG